MAELCTSQQPSRAAKRTVGAQPRPQEEKVLSPCQKVVLHHVRGMDTGHMAPKLSTLSYWNAWGREGAEAVLPVSWLVMGTDTNIPAAVKDVCLKDIACLVHLLHLMWRMLWGWKELSRLPGMLLPSRCNPCSEVFTIRNIINDELLGF